MNGITRFCGDRSVHVSHVLSAFIVIAIHAATASAGLITFSDDFNRADGAIGNGWSSSNVAIVNNAAEVTSSGTIRLSRSLSGFDTAIQVTYAVTEQAGDTFTSRFEQGFQLFDDGSLTGFGLNINRSNNSTNNSTVTLVNNGAVVSVLSSTFQFNSQLLVDATFDTDGTVSGTVSEGANVFAFDFTTPLSINKPGDQFVWHSTLSSAATTSPTFDNFSVSGQAVPEPSSLALLGIGGVGMLSFCRRRRRSKTV